MRTKRSADQLQHDQPSPAPLIQNKNRVNRAVKTGKSMGYDEKPFVVPDPVWINRLPGLYRRALLKDPKKPFDNLMKADDLPPELVGRYNAWLAKFMSSTDPDSQIGGPTRSVEDFIKKELTPYLPLAFTDPPPNAKVGTPIERDVPGLLSEASDNYMRGRWTQGEQDFIHGHGARIGEVYGRHHHALNRFGRSLQAGDYDLPNANTEGLKAQLSGQVDMTTFQPVLKQALSHIREQFTDHTLPAIKHRAVEAGHTGSTRHILLEKFGLNEYLQKQIELTDRMTHQAYQAAQDRVQNAHVVTNRLNEQAILSQRDNRQGVLDIFDRTNQTDDAFSARYLSTWNAPVSHTNQQLQDYASIIYGQHMGSKETKPIYRNRMAGVLGGALSGYAATGSIFGAVAGGILGSQ
ncbi:MAG: hypothetical protein N0E59_02300 [Candidatus Thiodiazotropha taylori]|nr:hypothetical protein [Candidatus Thiodiazotropha taylori]MCG8051933.1 hypothetical protein [Candidatus Thiodiazotropha taylori]MCG8109571.1 hypothetical protein [Candidatus Thiodiazotropha taylori]MCW4281915.1 hypothetical protein [Candidatus Thiodiazotropha taylori]MCW4306101.1 hypothetical protein [Candidatus Thiodiazotropha taylori]